MLTSILLLIIRRVFRTGESLRWLPLDSFSKDVSLVLTAAAPLSSKLLVHSIVGQSPLLAMFKIDRLFPGGVAAYGCMSDKHMHTILLYIEL